VQVRLATEITVTYNITSKATITTAEKFIQNGAGRNERNVTMPGGHGLQIARSSVFGSHSATSRVGVFVRYRTTQGCLRTSERARRFSASYCKSCGADQMISACCLQREQERTFVIKSRASAETFGGIRRSTFAIRLYVAARSVTPVSTRAPESKSRTKTDHCTRTSPQMGVSRR
jgi:hypothetical protein